MVMCNMVKKDISDICEANDFQLKESNFYTIMNGQSLLCYIYPEAKFLEWEEV